MGILEHSLGASPTLCLRSRNLFWLGGPRCAHSWVTGLLPKTGQVREIGDGVGGRRLFEPGSSFYQRRGPCRVYVCF